MINIKKANMQYGEKCVLNNVNLTIPPGTITTLIGANGAGKSTLLSMIGRLLDGTGEIIVDGRNLSAYHPKEFAQKLSTLRQTNHISVRLTVRELVSFGRYPHSQSRLNKKDWEIVDRSMSYMDLDKFADTHIDKMSGGERQRAFIAMVIAQDTKYILLDEPLNNLDMKHSVQIMKLLRNLVDEQQKSIILVLHDINFTSIYSDHIIALKDGRLLAQGGVHEVINSVVLQDIYDMEIPTLDQEAGRFCLYHA